MSTGNTTQILRADMRKLTRLGAAVIKQFDFPANSVGLSHVPVSPMQRVSLEVLNRVARRIRLGIPSHTSCTVILPEAQRIPFQLNALQRYTDIWSSCITGPQWQRCGELCFGGQILVLVPPEQQLLEHVGPPGDPPVARPPQELRTSLHHSDCILGIETKSDMPSFVCR